MYVIYIISGLLGRKSNVYHGGDNSYNQYKGWENVPLCTDEMS